MYLLGRLPFLLLKPVPVIQFLACLNPPLRFEIELVQLVFEDMRCSLLVILHGKCVSFVTTEPYYWFPAKLFF